MIRPGSMVKRARLAAAALSLASVALWSAGAGVASADVIAALPQNALSVSDGRGFMLGWEFSTSTTIDILGLAYYDAGGNGLGESHQVGIFDAGNGNVVVQATVPSGAAGALVNGFRVTPISFALPAGHYVMGGLMTGDTDEFLLCPSVLQELGMCSASVNTIPGLTYLSERELETTNFEMPTVNSPDALAAMFGPSFSVANPVPEPSSFVLLVCGIMVGLAGTAHVRGARRR